MPTAFTDSFSDGTPVYAAHVKQYADPVNDLESGEAWYRAATNNLGKYQVKFTTNEGFHVLDSLEDGQQINFKASHACPAAGAQLEVKLSDDSFETYPIYSGANQVAENEIAQNQLVSVIFNKEVGNNRFELVGGISSVGTGPTNSRLGDNSGLHQTGSHNTSLGAGAGQGMSGANGDYNTSVGKDAGLSLTAGSYNTFTGARAASNSLALTGEVNTASGYSSLYKLEGGDENTALGSLSLWSLVSGDENTAVGAYAGFGSTGSRNVFIGHDAGYLETGSDKLYISNSNTSSPLIYGEFNAGGVLQFNCSKMGFFGATTVTQPTGYTAFTNRTPDRTCDADSTSIAELADILGTLIEDLKSLGILSA